MTETTPSDRRFLGRDDVNDIESILRDDERTFGTVSHSVTTRGDAVFTWDYERTRPGLSKLYEKAKHSMWNGETDLDWSTDVDVEKVAREMAGAVQQFRTTMMSLDDSPVRTWGDREWTQFEVEAFNWRMSQFLDRKSTRLNSSHTDISRMPSSA